MLKCHEILRVNHYDWMRLKNKKNRDDWRFDKSKNMKKGRETEEGRGETLREEIEIKEEGCVQLLVTRGSTWEYGSFKPEIRLRVGPIHE